MSSEKAAPPSYTPTYGDQPIVTVLEAAQDTRRSVRSRCRMVRDLAKQLDVPLERVPFWGKSSWLVTAISRIQASGVGLCGVMEFRGFVKEFAKEGAAYHTHASIVVHVPRASELCASYASPCKSRDVRTRIGHGVAAAHAWQYGKAFTATCTCE